MEAKDFIAIGLILMASIVGGTLATLFRPVREGAFFLLIAGAVVTTKLDVNFFSHYWYRGTTRGIEVSFLDVLAFSVLTGSLLGAGVRRPRFFLPASLIPMLLFVCWAAVSVVLSEPKVYGVFELSKMARGVLVFLAAAFFVRSERELTILLVALGCAMCFEATLALKQRVIDGVYRATGSIDHANSLSMYACLLGPVFLAAANVSNFPGWVRAFCGISCAAAAGTVLLTISRAGIPVFVVITVGAALWCVSWKPTFRKALIIGCIVLVGTGVLYRSWDILKMRYGEASLEEEYFDQSSEGRGFYLRLANAILDDRPLGVGLNNWSYWVSKTYGHRLGHYYEDYDDVELGVSKEVLPSIHYAAPAHNLAALTAGELGWPGLILFMILWGRWFMMGAAFLTRRIPDAMHRMGVGIFFGISGVFLQSITEWTYRQTTILFTCHALLGALASMHYYRRRERQTVRQSRRSANPIDPMGQPDFAVAKG